MNLVYLRLEILRIVRSPQFALFTIAVPLGMFLLFGGLFGDYVGPDGVRASTTTMINTGAYGAMSGALFTGTRVATERTDGWQRQLRLTPMRGPDYLFVKLASAMAMALPVLVVVFVAGALRGVDLTGGQWLLTALAVWLAALPFAVLGLMLGLFGKGDTVGAMTGGADAAAGRVRRVVDAAVDHADVDDDGRALRPDVLARPRRRDAGDALRRARARRRRTGRVAGRARARGGAAVPVGHGEGRVTCCQSDQKQAGTQRDVTVSGDRSRRDCGRIGNEQHSSFRAA
ncbi:ABC transporter permease [Amycolatopsis sp. FDAARGOS 1241]|uniref:ABC transporter permease n=1 Tax=Amycolatopsis sp. FDAARGOS 1241 TaxID=2778070 RepID=UPI001EF1DB54|nr:ABC transporter permease [Amycolatopsis sp. FDAARGOS 1241]